MKIFAYVLTCAALQPVLSQAQDFAGLTNSFDRWLAEDIWPRAQLVGITRATFDAALTDTTPNWDLPGLNIPGQPPQKDQHQAEFRPPARYFEPGALRATAEIGRRLTAQHAVALDQIERASGVPAEILVAIWGRESSFGQAAIPHDAFEILSTRAYFDPRATYFTDELIAALQIVEQGFATSDEMKSSWAGALGQPQFMPSNYLQYADDGDGDDHADIWNSEPDTLASIARYLQNHGWLPGRDWGFEVTLQGDVGCDREGPDQGQTIAKWAEMGVTRVSGAAFPAAEASEQGFLVLPAGTFGPAFLVTANFSVLKDYNESDLYALFVGHTADRMAFGVGDFQRGWDRLDALPRSKIIQMQEHLIAEGHDVGGADGLIGNKTRRSIGRWQAQNGQPVTCFPSAATLSAMNLQ